MRGRYASQKTTKTQGCIEASREGERDRERSLTYLLRDLPDERVQGFKGNLLRWKFGIDIVHWVKILRMRDQ